MNCVCKRYHIISWRRTRKRSVKAHACPIPSHENEVQKSLWPPQGHPVTSRRGRRRSQGSPAHPFFIIPSSLLTLRPQETLLHPSWLYPSAAFISRITVTPSSKGFLQFFFFFSLLELSLAFLDLPCGSYGSPQSLLCWKPFAMFYLFCCCKTKCFSYLCPLVMVMFQIHRWCIPRWNGRHFSLHGVSALTDRGCNCLSIWVCQSCPPGQY